MAYQYDALDRKAAKFGNPIRTPLQLPSSLVTGAPDEAWDLRIQKEWWYNKATIQQELEKAP